ncbi:hypothetical protein D3C85_801280 [compost metagenome]
MLKKILDFWNKDSVDLACVIIVASAAILASLIGGAPIWKIVIGVLSVLYFNYKFWWEWRFAVDEYQKKMENE